MEKETVVAREKQLLRCIPDILKFKTLLYIGANTKRMQMMKLFRKAKYRIDILEVWRKNVVALRTWNKVKKAVRKIIKGDVRKFKSGSKYDVVMWWHGPEHVKHEELGAILRNLEFMTNHIIVLASPWGLVKQGSIGSNPFEKHWGGIYTWDWEREGYSFDALGEPDKGGTNLLAWKRMS
jgi:hypothetical protein